MHYIVIAITNDNSFADNLDLENANFARDPVISPNFLRADAESTPTSCIVPTFLRSQNRQNYDQPDVETRM